MKVSPDTSFLIFVDGGWGMIQLNANTGVYMGSTYVGNGNINYLYSSAISPDSSVIFVGGKDYSYAPGWGYWTSMSSSSLIQD